MSEWRVGRERAGGRGSNDPDTSAAVPGKQTLAERLPPAMPLIVDGDVVAPAQMTKAAFLELLHGNVVAAATAELGKADGCPYIEQYFAKYRQAPAAELAAVIARFAPASRGARSAGDLVAPLVARVRQGIQQWKTSGRLPADLESAAPGAAAAVKQPMTLRSLEAELGPGTALDGGTASKLSGGAVSKATVHSGPEAAKKAAEVDAKAFAVGDRIVMGAGAEQPGTLAGDALLAHELAHVAQQQDAVRDPAAKDAPIGAEAQAPEAAADRGATRAMLQLGGKQRKVTWDDVMTTGLQLQRCPGDSFPAGPPITGKEADQKIANVPMIRDFIHNDVQRGYTGEKLVRLFPDKKSYVKALMTEVGVFTMIPADKREAVTNEFAEHAKGFTDPASRKVYIQTEGTPAFVTIHEMMHVYTSATHIGGTAGLGEHFVEGVADYFTRLVCAYNAMPFKAAYADELKAVEALAAQLGDEQLAGLAFHGDVAGTKAILDSKAPGTWDAYRKKMRSPDYEEAADLLGGVKEANEARLAKEEAARDKANADAKAKGEAEDAKDRETWPPEGKTPVKARIVGKTVSGTMTRMMLGAGAANGIREGWTVLVTLTDGRTVTTKIVKAKRRVVYADIDSKLFDLIKDPIHLPVEIKPK